MTASDVAPVATTNEDEVKIDAKTLEIVLVQGDLSSLSTTQRLSYYRSICQASGLNPLSKPFEYIQMKTPGGKDEDKKLVLYAKAEAYDQIRNNKGISVTVVKREWDKENGVYTVTVAGKVGNRVDEASGSVAISKENGRWETNEKTGKKYFKGDGTFKMLSGEDLSNAMMKAETKSKRRLTISMTGLALAGVVTSDTDELPEEAVRAVDDTTLAYIKEGQKYIGMDGASMAALVHKYDPKATSLSVLTYESGVAVLNDICDAVLALAQGTIPEGLSEAYAAELAKHTKEAVDAEAKAFAEKF
jgi:hypothetical protein